MVRLPTFEPSVLEPRATFEPGPKGLREPKATFKPRVLEPRATIVPKCIYRCDIISWLVRLPTLELRATFEPGPKGLREPKATFEPRVLEPRATIVPKCMYGCDIISWLVR